MNCYENYVTLRAACGAGSSRSSLYVEDIPGMSVVNIAAAAGPEQQGANEIVADACRLAYERFKSDLMSGLRLSYAQKAIESVGGFRFGENIEPADPGAAGMRIKFLRTAYSKLRISRIYFKSAAAVTGLVISISDGVTVQYHTVTTSVDQEIVIEVDYSTFQGRVDISYDMTTVIPYTQSLVGHSSMACSSCTPNSGALNRIACYGFMPGVNEASTIYGLFVDATLECDADKAACSLLPSVKMEFLYLVGSILYEKRLASSRLNWIAVSKEYAEQKIQEYEEKYLQKMEGSERAFLSFLQNVDPLCTACRTLQYSYSV